MLRDGWLTETLGATCVTPRSVRLLGIVRDKIGLIACEVVGLGRVPDVLLDTLV